MRVYLLSSTIPALALLATACSPSDQTDTAANMPDEEAAPPAAEPAPAPAAPEVETAEAEPAPPPAPAEPAAAPAPSAEDAAMEQAEQAVEVRQAPMKLMAWSFGPLGGMLRGNAPFDAAVVEKNVTRVAQLAPMIPGVFEPDVTDYDLETEALPSIWDNKADFDMKAMDLVNAATAAAEAAAGGDEAATKMALGAVGQACGGCHDDYREDN